MRFPDMYPDPSKPNFNQCGGFKGAISHLFSRYQSRTDWCWRCGWTCVTTSRQYTNDTMNNAPVLGAKRSRPLSWNATDRLLTGLKWAFYLQSLARDTWPDAEMPHASTPLLPCCRQTLQLNVQKGYAHAAVHK